MLNVAVLLMSHLKLANRTVARNGKTDMNKKIEAFN
jgi:hypothetical protein